jgi:hypothetical protein
MGLDVWFPEDVARAIRAAETAGEAAAGEMKLTIELAAWLRGYNAALATMAAAFGVSGPQLQRYMVLPAAVRRQNGGGGL